MTWAAPPREALERVGAKHKQTHARSPALRPLLCCWGLEAAHLQARAPLSPPPLLPPLNPAT